MAWILAGLIGIFWSSDNMQLIFYVIKEGIGSVLKWCFESESSILIPLSKI